MADQLTTTVIGETILINGNLRGDEDLTVFGKIEGSIELTRTLNVEQSGIIKADVTVRNAVISGIVVGNINASDSVEITQEGRMVGDIKAPRVIIIEGAHFRGNIDMGDLEAPRSAGGAMPARTTRPSALGKPTAPTRPMGRLAAPARPVTAKGDETKVETPAEVKGKEGGEPPAKKPTGSPVPAGTKVKKKVVVRKG
jgi:cytoskeletal protein CcmA (bactofilin family)